MWMLFARAPPPDAPYWPGRRWLAAIDAIAWPGTTCFAMQELKESGELVVALVMTLLVASAARRLTRALLANHRYHFTTWRWGRTLFWMIALGALLKLGPPT